MLPPCKTGTSGKNKTKSGRQSGWLTQYSTETKRAAQVIISVVRNLYLVEDSSTWFYLKLMSMLHGNSSNGVHNIINLSITTGKRVGERDVWKGVMSAVPANLKLNQLSEFSDGLIFKKDRSQIKIMNIIQQGGKTTLLWIKDQDHLQIIYRSK